MEFITLNVFGEEYLYPKNLIPLSDYLVAATSGRYLERETLELDLDPSFKPAFDYIYHRLLEGGPWRALRVFPVGHFSEILQLAEFLGIRKILDEIRAYIIDHKIPYQQLVEAYPLYQNDLAIYNAALNAVLEQGKFYIDLPDWAKVHFDLNVTERPEDFLVAQLIIPDDFRLFLNKGSLVKVNPFALSSLPIDQDVRFYDGKFWTSLDEYNPIVGLNSEGKLDLFDYYDRVHHIPRIDLKQFEGKKPFLTPQGYLIYLPLDFAGDYIFTRYFRYLPDIKIAIV